MINYEAFFKITYGLYLVSSGDEGNGNGFISNAVFQVTSEPPQFAVCCNRDNYTAEVIKKTGVFAISILKQDVGSNIIGTFGYQSGRDINKMENVSIKTGESGVPVITDDAIAFLECKVKQTFDVGTHLIFIGQVVTAEILSEDEPITYAFYRNVKKGLAPKNAPTYIDKSKLEDKETIEASQKYKCPACGYIYDPEKGDEESGINPGTEFENLPESWVCPLCSTEKEDFIKI